MLIDRSIPIGVQLLYKHAIAGYDSKVSYTNVKEFIPDPLLSQPRKEFVVNKPFPEVGIP